MSGPRILLIDGDAAIQGFLHRALAGTAHVVTCGRPLVGPLETTPDLAILVTSAETDVSPSSLAEIKTVTRAPLLALLPAGCEYLRGRVLEAGADDCLLLPMKRRDLVARVQLALLDAEGDAQARRTTHHVGELAIDLTSETVRLGERAVALAPREYRVLAYLALRAGHAVSHRRLLRVVWGPRHMEETLYLRVCVAQLRRKLEHDPKRPRYLLTERGIGYRLAAE